MILSVCCAAVFAPAVAVAAPVIMRDHSHERKAKPVQDGIVLDVHQETMKQDHPFQTSIHRIELDAPSLLETGRICEDVAPEHTGFDVHDDDGYAKHAACEDLAKLCHNSTVGSQVRVSCPVTCYVCRAAEARQADGEDCFDSVSTGIRFRDGPKASCTDLINYCNHTSIGTQVQMACKLSCGLCDLHQEGPYLDEHDNCVDLPTHEEPQFTISGLAAGCTDVAPFCKKHPDSYLIRHKCPLTCGICGNAGSAAKTGEEATDVEIPGDAGGCSSRRRWGFCSTRRRRNV